MPGETRNAGQDAAAAGCIRDQIVKSIVLAGIGNGHIRLFLTAGGNRVDPDRASALAGTPLGRADAALVRRETGFAIGGVAAVGHPVPVRAWFDPRLLDFEPVWPAAGTPRHIFAAAPAGLVRASGAAVALFTA